MRRFAFAVAVEASFVLIVTFLALLGNALQSSTSPPRVDVTLSGRSLRSLDDGADAVFGLDERAFHQQTPHAGCHYDSESIVATDDDGESESRSGGVRSLLRRVRRRLRRRRRFMEGWYYRVTLPEEGESFAFIFSIEDPESTSPSNSPLTLSCAQVMGPGDSYLVRSEPTDANFWARRDSQSLGCVFDLNGDVDSNDEFPSTALSRDDFRRRVRSGFQVTPWSLRGRLEGHDGSGGGVGAGQGVEGTCDFDLTIDPIYGWGGAAADKQRSSAGWLASYPVFEPHWQVTLAHARASGTITWNGRTYDVKNEPFYAEKNWGGSFPLKWYWAQCNSFDGHPNTSVTVGGGVRTLPFTKQTEQPGLIGVHHDSVFYECVPWIGEMDWDVAEWGRWVFRGRCESVEPRFEVELTAVTDAPGVKLRAPTKDDGMVYACRDSFYADVKMSLWRLEYDAQSKSYVRDATILDGATSSQCAVEVGGGPWWDSWKGSVDMRQPAKGLVRLPYRLRTLKGKLSSLWRKRS